MSAKVETSDILNLDFELKFQNQEIISIYSDLILLILKLPVRKLGEMINSAF